MALVIFNKIRLPYLNRRTNKKILEETDKINLVPNQGRRPKKKKKFPSNRSRISLFLSQNKSTYFLKKLHIAFS